jgi:hypothetical protein
MIDTSHKCWWTQHRVTELADTGERLIGAGLPHEALQYAASVLKAECRLAPIDGDEDNESLSLGTIAIGETHDDCFVSLSPSSSQLKRAILKSLLELHAMYLRAQVDWSDVLDGLEDRLSPGMTLRFKSRPRQQELTVQNYRGEAGFLGRLLAKKILVDCTGRKATFQRG